MRPIPLPDRHWPRCERCEFIGPDWQGDPDPDREAHRAFHHFKRTYVEEVGGLRGLIEWLNGLLTHAD